MQEQFEIQPLMPLSGQVPIQINQENKAFLATTPKEEKQTLNRIQQNSIPWLPLILVPLLALTLFLAFFRLRRPSTF